MICQPSLIVLLIGRIDTRIVQIDLEWAASTENCH